jgi:hypothetical protein
MSGLTGHDVCGVDVDAVKVDAHAAGLHTSRLDRSQLVYNQPDPRVPDLLVCRPEIADAVLKRTHELSSPEVPHDEHSA